MAKIFQLSLFMNVIVIGIAIGVSRMRLTKKRIIAMYWGYFLFYLLAGGILLWDTSFLVPTP